MPLELTLKSGCAEKLASAVRVLCKRSPPMLCRHNARFVLMHAVLDFKCIDKSTCREKIGVEKHKPKHGIGQLQGTHLNVKIVQKSYFEVLVSEHCAPQTPLRMKHAFKL
eukprot:1140333-Pelagomonas_calceolata.AAC.8